MDALVVLGEAGAILVLSIAALVMSVKDRVSLEKIKDLRDSGSSK
jgi:protein PsiE